MPEPSEKVQMLLLKQFTVFEEASFHFSRGINLLIGANGTGKSHMMKIIYTLLKVAESKPESDIPSKLRGVFRLEHSTDHLISVRHDNPNPQNWIKLVYGNGSLQFSIRRRSDPRIGDVIRYDDVNVPKPPPSLYLPAQEFLSINEGFISAYDRRELPYDETYYDLALALNALPLREEKLADVQEVITLLRNMLTDEQNAQKEVVTQQNGRFLFHLPEGELDVHLVAEGYRKIATLYHLLRNGSLTKDGILFWDEPEANLNPRLIVGVVRMLRSLAATGMQIFVATHDYLLSHELSLLAEYPSDPRVDIRFFALHRPDRLSGVLVESGETLAEMTHNPILEEFAAHYDRESSLFHNS